MRNTNSACSFALCASTSPVSRTRLGMSIVDSGSVHSSTSSSPAASRDSALRALRAGSGHLSPRRSRTVSAIAKHLTARQVAVKSVAARRLTATGPVGHTGPMLSQPIQRLTRLAPLPDILARIDAIGRPVPARDTDLAQACGRVLGADVSAPAPLPAQAVALRDGFAVASHAVTDAGPYAPVP